MLGPADTLFIHIPKCAGTSIEAALGAAALYPRLGLDKTVTRPHPKILFGGGMQHLTIREIAQNYPEIAGRPGLWSFALIRDPIDRFVSDCVWRSRPFAETAATDAELVAAFDEALEGLVGLSRRLRLFDDPFGGMAYCEGDPDTLHPNDAGRHLLPQCAFLYDRGRATVDAIYPLEAMPALEADLKRRGALSGPIGRRMVGASARRLRELVPPNGERTLREIYRHDFRLREAVAKAAAESGSGHCPGAALPVETPTGRPARANPGPSIPRRLWLYWHQGWEEAPPLVRRCADSWQARNPTFEINLLSAATLGRHMQLPKRYARRLQLPLPALADVIRIHLLAAHGGVWADTTAWCARPLDDWLYHVATAGFFAYSRPADDRPLATWFLAATPHHPLIERVKEAVDDFWKHKARKNAVLELEAPKSADYFWLHYLFGRLIRKDPIVGPAWRQVPKVLSRDPHVVLHAGLGEPAAPEVEFHIRSRLANVYKLSRRNDLPEDLAGTNLALLYDSL